MSRDRFLLLLKFLPFNDNENQSEEDKLFKRRLAVQHLKENFGCIMIPYRNFCIDESFKQFIPSKRHKYGIKIFILCDSYTEFVSSFLVYTGSQTDVQHYKGLAVAGSIVMTLMKPYLQKGHNLFLDSCYTSPSSVRTVA